MSNIQEKLRESVISQYINSAYQKFYKLMNVSEVVALYFLLCPVTCVALFVA